MSKPPMLSEKQELFLKNRLRRINLLYGSVRSGKTWISLLKWALWVGQQPDTKGFLMVGRTITTLERNCLVLLEALVGDNFAYSISQKRALLFGRTIWLEGANDKTSESKIRGMTLMGCYMDELTQIPKEFYMMVLSRLSEDGAALIATTNPDHPKHYVNTEIIKNKVLDKQVLKFLLDENLHIPESYKENLRKEYTGVFYDRFILGEFVRAEGVVFRDFADHSSKYIIDKSDVPASFRTVGVGYDLGGNKSNFALVATGITHNNDVVVLRVVETEPVDLKPEDVEKTAINFICEVEKEFGVRCDYCNIDDNYYTTVNSLNNWRYIFDSAARIKSKMPLSDRPLMLSKLMALGRFKLVSGECDALVDQLQNAVYDDKSDKAIICDDGSMNIDCIDSFFYSVADDYLYLTD